MDIATRSRLLCVVTFLVGASFLPASTSAGALKPSSAAVPDGVLIDDVGVVRLVDPATGKERWRFGARGELTSIVVGVGGIVFLGEAAEGAVETVVSAVGPGSDTPAEIGRVPGVAAINAVASQGDRLLLLTYQGPFPIDPRPIGLTTLGIPAEWRSDANPIAPTRGFAGGILAPPADEADQFESYHLKIEKTADGRVTGGTLWFGTYDETGQPTWTDLSIPLEGGYPALLRSPDGERLIVVEFFGQTVQAVDISSRRLVASVRFGQRPDKEPPCAAALTPLGDRLFLISAGGVVVLDPQTLTQLGKLWVGAVGDAPYCLAVAPDGRRLYVTTFKERPDLLTLDAATGAELARVTIDGEDVTAFLVDVVGEAGTM
jgi:DNA-binding beta-propeller fold protein YncE